MTPTPEVCEPRRGDFRFRADGFFDFVSPLSSLQWPRLLALGDRPDLRPRPIVFGALLERLGTRGPAEIAGKRRFTWRMALWQAQPQGTPLRFVPVHPFNPALFDGAEMRRLDTLPAPPRVRRPAPGSA